MAKQIPGMTGWEELIVDVDDVDKIAAGLFLLNQTFPGRFNYENLSTRDVLRKMMPRRCGQGPWVEGARVFSRIEPGTSVVDVAVLFFLRLESVNAGLADAYCLTVGVRDGAAITGAQLRADMISLCNHVKNDSVISRFEVVSEKLLPGDFPTLPATDIVKDAFNDALVPNGQTPQSGQLAEPVDITPTSPPWPASLKSWRVTL